MILSELLTRLRVIEQKLTYLVDEPELGEGYAASIREGVRLLIKEIGSCAICGHPANGPMLVMGNVMGHAFCVHEQLENLEDPDA